MFHTLMKLYDTTNKYIYFGGSVIYCDDNNVCSIYNNILNDNDTSST